MTLHEKSYRKLFSLPKENYIINSCNIISILIKFQMHGNLRFLSHAESLRVFQRGCTRAGIKLAYNKGFNPRPKLSLPLPRSVGLEVDEDLLALKVCTDETSFDCEQLRTRLSQQLMQGFKLGTVSIANTTKSFNGGTATYTLTKKSDSVDDNLKNRIENLLTSSQINIERTVNSKGATRKIDVRRFLNSISIETDKISVKCKFGNSGSIRVDEILELLELDVNKLSAPVRRTRVCWD